MGNKIKLTNDDIAKFQKSMEDYEEKMDQSQRALFVVRKILTDSTDYTWHCEENGDGYYKMHYQNLTFIDKEGNEHKGGIIIPKCRLSLWLDIEHMEGKFSEPVIDTIYATGDNAELFSIYFLDEDGEISDKE